MTNNRPSVEPACRRWTSFTAVGLIIVVHASLLGWGAFCHSPGIDEWGHLPAGLLHWRYGRYDAYRVNPPLVRLAATLPLIVCGVDIDPNTPQSDGVYRPEALAGFALYLERSNDVLQYFAIARLACIPFSVLGALVCYFWSRSLYGRYAGIVAVALWCFSPNVLGNAQMITPDTGATAFGLAANYAFWVWLQSPSWRRTMLAGIALGLALLTKTTWVFLPVLWISLSLFPWSEEYRFSKSVIKLCAMNVLALIVLNAGYEFSGCLTRLGTFPFTSETLSGIQPSKTKTAMDNSPDILGNRFASTLFGSIPVPLPRDYVLGIDRQKRDFEVGFPSYLRGKWRWGGWWYYYIYAVAIKVPLGSWGLIGCALWMSFTANDRQRWKAEVFLLAPALIVLVIVSSQTGFNHHLRYVLPAFPYAFIYASKSVQCRLRKRDYVRYLTCVLFVSVVASSIWTYPHSLSYFNEGVGGPRNGHRHLLDSNVDWGQDLIYLRKWLDKHCEVSLDGIILTMGASGAVIDESAPAPPKHPAHGWYALSVSQLHLPGDPYGYFAKLNPDAMAGYSIFIYHVTECQARQLSSPEFASEGFK